jgi:hypothetical protein
MENGSRVADPIGVGQVRRARRTETEADPWRATDAIGHGERARPEVRIEYPEVPEQGVASRAYRRTPKGEQEDISDVVSLKEEPQENSAAIGEKPQGTIEYLAPDQKFSATCPPLWFLCCGTQLSLLSESVRHTP